MPIPAGLPLDFAFGTLLYVSKALRQFAFCLKQIDGKCRLVPEQKSSHFLEAVP